MIEVKNLTKFYGDFKAVDDISFDIYPGETFGLVGESGCGKSTTGRCIMRLTEPTSGTVVFDGQDVSKLKGKELKKMRHDMQYIFQDPYASLNPRMTIGEIVSEPLVIHGDMPDKAQRMDHVRHLLDIVGLNPEHINRYPHEFSGGQRQRVGIARALAVNPKLIVCDEPVSALDVSIQAQVLNLLDDLKDQFGLTYLFIAHGLNVVKHISDRVGVMYLGRLMEVAPKNSLYHEPLCPYTQALLSAIPSPDPKLQRKRIILEGDVPSPIDPPAGCRFASRCFAKVGACDVSSPDQREVLPDHLCSCHRYDNVPTDAVRQLALDIQYDAARPTYGRGSDLTNADPVVTPETDVDAEVNAEAPVAP